MGQRHLDITPLPTTFLTMFLYILLLISVSCSSPLTMRPYKRDARRHVRFSTVLTRVRLGNVLESLGLIPTVSNVGQATGLYGAHGSSAMREEEASMAAETHVHQALPMPPTRQRESPALEAMHAK